MIKIFLLSLGWISSLAAAPLDKIIAVVDNEVILESELRQEVSNMAAQLRQKQIALPSRDIFIGQVLERLIIKNLQMQYAVRRGIRISDAMLGAAVEDIAAKNNLSLTDFRKVLEKDGYSYTAFRESIRESMILNQLRKVQIGDKIIISDREIDNFLATQQIQGSHETSYRLQHILVSLPDAPSPEVLQQAQEKIAKIQQSLARGISFSTVASSYSDGQKALEGGDLGWRKAGELPSLFANVVPTLSVSQVSKVIRSESGFHLIKLSDKKSQAQHIIQQTKASHILVKTNDITNDEIAEKKLNLLKKRIEQGERFVDLARAHSDDMVSALRGGSLGWTTPGMMVPEFEAEMNKLAINEMSPVFKSRFGWHLILLQGRREENMAAEYQRSQARQQIHSRRVEEETNDWLRQLRDEAYVEYREF